MSTDRATLDSCAFADVDSAGHGHPGPFYQCDDGTLLCRWCFSDRRTEPRPDGLSLITAATVVPQAVSWLWQGRIPTAVLSLLVGPAGRGKTTLACELAARVSRGQLGRPPANVLIASTEDSIAHTLVPRLMAAGADLRLISFVSVYRDGIQEGLTLPDDVTRLEDAVAETGAALVVLDPVVGHLSGAIDSHKDHSVRRALGPLAMLADRTGAAVVGIGHLNKGASGDVLNRLGGSVGFGAAARSVLLFSDDPDDEESAERLLAHGKCNVGPHAPTLRFRVESRTVTFDGREIPTSGLVWLGEDTSSSIQEMLNRGAADPDRGTQDLAAAVILDALAERSRRWADLVELCKDEGASEHTARRARDQLKRSGSIEVKKSPVGWFWNLPMTSGQVADGQVEKVPLTGEFFPNQEQLAHPFGDGQVGAERSYSPLDAAADIVLEGFPGAEMMSSEEGLE